MEVFFEEFVDESLKKSENPEGILGGIRKATLGKILELFIRGLPRTVEDGISEGFFAAIPNTVFVWIGKRTLGQKSEEISEELFEAFHAGILGGLSDRVLEGLLEDYLVRLYVGVL